MVPFIIEFIAHNITATVIMMLPPDLQIDFFLRKYEYFVRTDGTSIIYQNTIPHVK